MDCLFCKIVKGDIKAKVVYENPSALALLDIHPLAPGHTFIIPKFHAESIIDLPDNLIADVFKAVKVVTTALQKTFEPDGFTIGINQGRFGGHTVGVDHLHIHIIPRFKDDKGGSIHSLVDNPPKETLDEVMERISKNFDAIDK